MFILLQIRYGTNQSLFYDESFYKIQIIQGVSERDGLTAQFIGTEIETSAWDTNLVQSASQSTNSDASVTRCPVQNNYTLSGSSVSDTFEFLIINVLKCSPLDNVTCASDAEIDAQMNGGRVHLGIINSYVDFDDYDTVVKTYVDARYGVSLFKYSLVFSARS